MYCYNLCEIAAEAAVDELSNRFFRLNLSKNTQSTRWAGKLLRKFNIRMYLPFGNNEEKLRKNFRKGIHEIIIIKRRKRESAVKGMNILSRQAFVELTFDFSISNTLTHADTRTFLFVLFRNNVWTRSVVEFFKQYTTQAHKQQYTTHPLNDE